MHRACGKVNMCTYYVCTRELLYIVARRRNMSTTDTRAVFLAEKFAGGGGGAKLGQFNLRGAKTSHH